MTRALVPAPLGVALASGCAPSAVVCSQAYDTAARPVDPTYVPYRWCTDIQSEADRIHGDYACVSDEVDLRGEVIPMNVAPAGALEGSLTVVGVEATERVEVVTWYVDVTFAGEAFAAVLESAVEVYRFESGDRTWLFDGLYPSERMEGWLFEALEGDQDIDIYSATAIGEPHKEWTVSVGNFSEAVELRCE